MMEIWEDATKSPWLVKEPEIEICVTFMLQKEGNFEKIQEEKNWGRFLSVQFSSVAQSYPTLCDPMNCSTPGLPVHHQLPEFTQTHVHQVSDAIQPSLRLSSPSPPAPNPSQHQSFPVSQLFTWGGPSTGVSALASFFPKNTQDWSPSEWTGWISLQSKGLSLLQHHSSKASILRHSAFFSPTLPSIHDHWKNHSLDYMHLCWQSNVSAFEYTI